MKKHAYQAVLSIYQRLLVSYSLLKATQQMGNLMSVPDGCGLAMHVH